MIESGWARRTVGPERDGVAAVAAARVAVPARAAAVRPHLERVHLPRLRARPTISNYIIIIKNNITMNKYQKYDKTK